VSRFRRDKGRQRAEHWLSATFIHQQGNAAADSQHLMIIVGMQSYGGILRQGAGEGPGFHTESGQVELGKVIFQRGSRISNVPIREKNDRFSDESQSLFK